jgi:hypothetical protein
MSIIKSYLIENAAASAGLEYKIKVKLGLPIDSQPRFMVLKTFIDQKIVYVAWAGGEMRDGEVFLTELGQAAADVLAALPVGSNKTLIMQELKVGKIPVRTKVKKALKKAPRNSKIIFFGDMSNSLDGEFQPSLNLLGSTTI